MNTEKPKPRVAYLLGTWFGCGYSKVAPGTVGTLGALPLHWLLSQLPRPAHIAAVLLVSAVGVWASQAVSDHEQDKDPSKVVIDEVAGVLLALLFVPATSLWVQGIAVAGFRVFDISKPPPIRQAERVQPAGVGIMLDDLIAGLVAGGIAWWASGLL